MQLNSGLLVNESLEIVPEIRLTEAKITQMQFSGLDESSGAIVDQPGPGVKHVSGYPFLDNHAINLVCMLNYILHIVVLVVHTG